MSPPLTNGLDGVDINLKDEKGVGGFDQPSSKNGVVTKVGESGKSDDIGNTASLLVVPPGSASVQSVAGPSGWNGGVEVDIEDLRRKRRKLEEKGFTGDEVDSLLETSTGIQLSLALDQAFTLYPPAPTPFESYEDVVDRLLPYHIWQIHDEELASYNRGQKRERARDEWDMKEAAGLTDRIRKVQERFAKARRRADDHPSPLPSLISLINHSATQLRNELQLVQQNLRAARVAYDTLESEAKKERERIERVRIEKERAERIEEEGRRRAAAAAVAAAAENAARISAAEAASALAASNANSVARGRGGPRGRSRGRGRGGNRENNLGHSQISQNSGSPSKVDPSASGPVSNGARSTRAHTASIGTSGGMATSSAVPPNPVPPSTTNTTPSSGTGGTPPAGPVSITVSINLIPQFVTLGLLALPVKPDSPKTPATVMRTSEDRKSVVLSINLAACSQVQLQGLAKLLNVSAKPGSGSGSGNPSSAAGAGVGSTSGAASSGKNG